MRSKSILIPEPDNIEPGVVSLAHKSLVENQGYKSVMSLPLYLGDQCIGGMTLQRSNETQFSHYDAQASKHSI